MANSLTWLAQALLGAGLKVAEVDGWKDRGHGDVGPIRGVILHHTAGAPTGNMPTLDLVIKGRTGANALAGPLANLALGRDGTFYVVAAGRAYHAGVGSWKGIATGNTSFIGIEAENTGLPGDAWPDVQMKAYQHGVAAILKHINADEGWCCGHKEYAPTRKIDPSFEMDPFRAAVRDILHGNTPPPAQIAHTDSSGHPTLRRGSTGDAVKQLQTSIGLTPNGVFDADTEAKVRAFQRTKDLVPDGIVGPATWAQVAPGPG